MRTMIPTRIKNVIQLHNWIIGCSDMEYDHIDLDYLPVFTNEDPDMVERSLPKNRPAGGLWSWDHELALVGSCRDDLIPVEREVA